MLQIFNCSILFISLQCNQLGNMTYSEDNLFITIRFDNKDKKKSSAPNNLDRVKNRNKKSLTKKECMQNAYTDKCVDNWLNN
jgi:hypothetical protein